MYKHYLILWVIITSGVFQVYGQDWKSKYYTLQQRVEEKRISRKNLRETPNSLSEKWGKYTLDSVELPPMREPKPLTPLQFTPSSSEHIPSQQRIKSTQVEILKIDTTSHRLRIKSYHNQTWDELPDEDIQGKIAFFGKSIPVRDHTDMAFSLQGNLSPTRISWSWKKLSNSTADRQILDLLKYSYYLGLNDWGYCLLINEVSKHLYPRDINAQTLFNLYALAQAGYHARIGQHNNRIYLMVPTKERVYGYTFLKKGNTKYYVMDLNGTIPQLNKAFVLDLTFPFTDDIISFSTSSRLKLGNDILNKQYNFYYGGKKYQVHATIDRQLVKFYNTYPFTDWHIQLSAPMSPYVHQTLIKELKQLVAGRSEADAANMILRFVQQAFPYKTDTEQFGSENYLFAEEMLYYPYSDCEDRSALYAYLVKNILGLEVVGLLFPGHAAVAVKFRRAVDGAYVSYQGKQYTICDPTYVNADIGNYAPQVNGKDVRIIAFGN